MQWPNPSLARSVGLPVHLSGAPRAADPGLVVLFDRDCCVCQETVRTLRRWDHGRRLEFLPLQEARGSERSTLRQLATTHHLGDALHVVDGATGEVFVGGQAALAILDALPGGWLLRPWAGLPSTGLAADVIFRLASRHRDRVAWVVGLRDDVPCPIETDEPREEEPVTV